MAFRTEAYHPEFNRVQAGHFREGADYATWRQNGTDDWLLIHTVAGSGRFGGTMDDVVTTPGDAVVLRPNETHDYSTASGSDSWELAFAHFHPRADWLPLLDWPQQSGLGLIHVEGEVHTRVTSELKRSARFGRRSLANAELFALNALEKAILWLDTQNELTTRTDERVIAVIEYVGSHLSEQLDVDRLAAVIHLSPSRLTHLFTEQLGISPQRYVERERITLAKQLLDLTTRPIAAIAREVGWDDPLYFSQRFRRFTGLSPTAFRQRALPGRVE